MNMITATHAVSLFPRHTFVDRKAFVTRQWNPITDNLTYNWSRTHCRDFQRQTEGDAIDDSLWIGRRRVGDQQCWTIRILEDAMDMSEL